MRQAIIVVGPTASGKSAFAVQLAQAYQTEIISADSMQIYRKLDIGTAKSTPDEMRGIPHHGIDIASIGDAFSVADFQRYAFREIDRCNQSGKIPIIAGGTGLYIQSLLYDLDFSSAGATKKIVEPDINTEALYLMLQEKDPSAAEKIHPNNRRRVVRALQIASEASTPRDDRFRVPREDFQAVVFGLHYPRDVLCQRIEARVDQMLTKGLIDECKRVLFPFGRHNQAAAAIGYQETIDFLKGLLTVDELRQSIIVHTRQYAKRQMTWFRRMPEIHWLDMETMSVEDVFRRAKEVIQREIIE